MKKWLAIGWNGLEQAEKGWNWQDLAGKCWNRIEQAGICLYLPTNLLVLSSFDSLYYLPELRTNLLSTCSVKSVTTVASVRSVTSETTWDIWDTAVTTVITLFKLTTVIYITDVTYPAFLENCLNNILLLQCPYKTHNPILQYFKVLSIRFRI